MALNRHSCLVQDLWLCNDMNKAMPDKDTSFAGDFFHILGAAIKGAAMGAALFFGVPTALALVGFLL